MREALPDACQVVLPPIRHKHGIPIRCFDEVADHKGGHLAVRRSDKQLILRDTGQTPLSDMQYFMDEKRHPYFHTNNLWFNIEDLRDLL